MSEGEKNNTFYGKEKAKNPGYGHIKKIRSPYIMKIIFSFLNNIKKLNIIYYNKRIQNNLNINIEDYKNISQKYIIGDRNGNGKEYIKDTKILIFEGEYLNGKRNGKGKEYERNQLIFEGEYLNGKRNGKGKEYYFFGQLLFEGEYLNGKKWTGKGFDRKGVTKFKIKNGIGKGKEYDYTNGKIKFEGKYLNGLKNGKGKEFYEDHVLEFEGEYLNGLKNGKGKQYYHNGNLKFEGEYYNDKRWNGYIYLNLIKPFKD